MSNPHSRLFLGLLMIVVLPGTGCTLFSSSDKKLPTQVEDGFEGQKIVVIIEKDASKSRHELPWREGLFLQDVVTSSGVQKRFNNMKVVLKRPIENSVQTIPMPAKYQPRTKRLANETNYAVHPGDFVIITDDSKTAVDLLVESVTKFMW